MQITQSTDKKLEMVDSGTPQLIGGILATFVGLCMIIILVTSSWMSLFIWPVALLLSGLGVYLVIKAKNKQVTLLKGGLSEIVEIAIVGTKDDRQDFRTDSIAAVCYDTITNFRQRNPSSAKTALLDKIPANVLLLKLNDDTEILLEKFPATGGYKVKNVEIPVPKTSPLLERARTLSIFLNVPMQNLTLPDASAIFGSSTPANTPAPTAATAPAADSTSTPPPPLPAPIESPTTLAPSDTITTPADALQTQYAVTPEPSLPETSNSQPPTYYAQPPEAPAPAATDQQTTVETSAQPSNDSGLDQEAEAAMNAQLVALEQQSEVLDQPLERSAPQMPVETPLTTPLPTPTPTSATILQQPQPPAVTSPLADQSATMATSAAPVSTPPPLSTQTEITAPTPTAPTLAATELAPATIAAIPQPKTPSVPPVTPSTLSPQQSLSPVPPADYSSPPPQQSPQ